MILCLGDLGRSPRMQYHALSCAKAGMSVDLLGYEGSDLHPSLSSNALVHVHRFHVALKYSVAASTSSLPSRLARLVLAPLKVGLQLMQLLGLMFSCPTPDFILVQNPPSIPSLLCCAVVSLLRSSSVIIDWHNFGYSLIALSLGPYHRLTALHRWYEHLFSHTAQSHLCVTQAMQSFLQKEWGVRATVLYDRPPREFHPLDSEGKHELWVQLQEGGWVDTAAIELKFFGRRLDDGTLLTRVDPVHGGVVMREERPVVLVSSTSWTADEDFSLLLEAVKEFEEVREEEMKERQRREKRRSADDEKASESAEDGVDEEEEEEKVSDEDVNSSPATLLHVVHHLRRRRRRQQLTLHPLLVLITGKGPLLAAFLSLTSSLRLRHCHISTLFLPFHMYPALLGSADLGLSFHTSSSGLDLPMKVVDMFGAGLPVLAVDFKALPELLKEGETGYTFKDGQQLGSLVEVMIGEWPDDGRMRRMRERVQEWGAVRWEQSWAEHAAPLFLSAPSSSYWSTLLSTLLAHVLTLLSSIPSRVRFLLLFMLAATVFRVTSYPIPALPPVPSITSLYASLSELSLPSLLSSLTSFAQSPAASLIVLSVIGGVMFWLFVVYRVNRAVGDEAGAKALRGPARGQVRELYTSSEEDKEE